MSKFIRKRNVRDQQKKIIIFTEGICTEKNYFEWLKNKIETQLRKLDLAVIINWTGRSNESLVDYANDQRNAYLEIDEIWLVFDEDTSPNWKFDNAISQAKSFGMNVAYSNECFELWILLHFEFLNTWIWRDQYYKKLSNNPCLWVKNYEKKWKNIEDIFSRLEDETNTAIKRAEKLLNSEEYDGLPYSQQKPSTTVHLLVQALLNLQK